ncbi:hypothetical protein [Kribbella catacumbae]|uniref:hypothetical protein n=1 Tax=Kribbella catacumbae TaxID=460086 RepID=UPI0012F7BF2E|nr:hypothetical protein [Kribbella catacumbae]
MAGELGLDAQVLVDVGRLREALGAFDTGAARAARSWQRRLSDVGGQSATPGEVAFLDLKSTFDALVRSEDRLLSPKELIPHRRQALAALDALDELVDAAARVARYQQAALDDLIRTGSLFIPLRDLASTSLPFSSRRVLHLGSSSRWTRTSIAMYFSELTDTLAKSAAHLSIAADVARGLSGTTHHRRPIGDKYARMMPPPLATRRLFVAESTGFPDQGPEPISPGR